MAALLSDEIDKRAELGGRSRFLHDIGYATFGRIEPKLRVESLGQHDYGHVGRYLTDLVYDISPVPVWKRNVRHHSIRPRALPQCVDHVSASSDNRQFDSVGPKTESWPARYRLGRGQNDSLCAHVPNYEPSQSGLGVRRR